MSEEAIADAEMDRGARQLPGENDMKAFLWKEYCIRDKVKRQKSIHGQSRTPL
jgi:hypothetical protein